MQEKKERHEGPLPNKRKWIVTKDRRDQPRRQEQSDSENGNNDKSSSDNGEGGSSSDQG